MYVPFYILRPSDRLPIVADSNKCAIVKLQQNRQMEKQTNKYEKNIKEKKRRHEHWI